MNTLYFWKDWNRPYKQLYFFLLFTFLFTLICILYGSFIGSEQVIKWEVETELEPVKIVVDQFSRNLFNFTVESNGYYALDKFVTTEVQTNALFSYLYLGLIVIGILFILTTISYMEIYWFMAGMLFFLLFLFTLNLEMIQLFSRIDRLPMVILFLIYGGICFLFNSFIKSTSYLIRLLTFLFLTIGIGILIQKYATVAHPFIYIANFGSMFPILITLIFVFLIGYDLIKGLLYLVSGPKTSGSKNSYLNFIFASLLYLANVLLLLLKKLMILDLNIIYLNPIFLFIFSSILGIWFFRKRTELFKSVLPFVPAGAFIYLSLAIISFSGLGYALLNGNIGIIDAYERIIIYGHLFLGGIFLLYVLINFTYLFDKKVSIYEIVYQPTRLTFLIVPTVAITFSCFFFLYQKKQPYNLAMAGYYCYAGDIMTQEANYPLAFQYYQKAVSYDYPNHRANYSIASLSATLNNKQTAKGYYENALYRDPTAESYIGLSNAYLETGELFKALFQLQEGIQKFPNDGRILNNLAVMFHKSNIPDSSIHYFLKAKYYLKNKEVPFSNVLYIMAKNNLFADADSLMMNESYPNYISFINNKLAISNQLNKKSEINFDQTVVNDSTLNANTFAYLVNSNINSLRDTTRSVPLLIAEKINYSSNEFFKEKLQNQLILKDYYSGNRLKAYMALTELNLNTNSTNFEFSTQLGKWLLEQSHYSLAAEYFLRSSKGGDLSTQLNYVIASSFNGDKENAVYISSQLIKSPDPTINLAATKLTSILSINKVTEALNLEEPERLQYYCFNLFNKSPEILAPVYQSFQNSQVKILAGVSLCSYYLSKNNLEKATLTFQTIKEIPMANVYAEGERNYIELLLYNKLNNVDFLLKNSNSLVLNPSNELSRLFFNARQYELSNDTANALLYYEQVLKNLPFMEIAVSNGLNYLSKHGQQQKAYDYSINILQVNPSIPMLKAYFLLCIDMEMINYAEATLEDLKGKLEPIEYLELKKKYIQIADLY